MSIVTCPACKTRLRITDQSLSTANCPKCGLEIDLESGEPTTGQFVSGGDGRSSASRKFWRTLTAWLVWFPVALWTVVSYISTMHDIGRADSAIQQTTVASIGCLSIVFGFVLGRAISEIMKS